MSNTHGDWKLNQPGAVFSACGTYRYQLTRFVPKFGLDKGRVCWIMLNPSTADETEDDPTIRRCIGFTDRLGYSELNVVNLFAYRATDPKDLAAVHRDSDVSILGPKNLFQVDGAIRRADLVIAAWGAGIKPVRNFADALIGDVMRMAEWVKKPIYHLGLTRDGIPRHPLYLRKDADLAIWYDPTPVELTVVEGGQAK